MKRCDIRTFQDLNNGARFIILEPEVLSRSERRSPGLKTTAKIWRKLDCHSAISADLNYNGLPSEFPQKTLVAQVKT